ncbi:hypothetical protein [Modestobacter altitudinis]|uniref:hypothetical protein n=1 Tax=Modestobacter altitudinis TaxID=2213158 RepID=UPI00110C9ADB|nr:hypothetical protein [Modestobacter altitudinis]
MPSGRAEVELFRFWEEDLVGALSPDVVAVGPPHAVRPARPGPAKEPSDASADPLWWAGLVFVVVLMAVVV